MALTTKVPLPALSALGGPTGPPEPETRYVAFAETEPAMTVTGYVVLAVPVGTVNAQAKVPLAVTVPEQSAVPPEPEVRFQ